MTRSTSGRSLGRRVLRRVVTKKRACIRRNLARIGQGPARVSVRTRALARAEPTKRTRLGGRPPRAGTPPGEPQGSNRSNDLLLVTVDSELDTRCMQSRSVTRSTALDVSTLHRQHPKRTGRRFTGTSGAVSPLGARAVQCLFAPSASVAHGPSVPSASERASRPIVSQTRTTESHSSRPLLGRRATRSVRIFSLLPDSPQRVLSGATA